MMRLFKTFLLLLCVGAKAATYYVSPTGSNGNPGTEAQPWRTMDYADGQLLAGDTLYIRSGIYEGNTNCSTWNAVATAASPITLMSYPGERAIFNITYTGDYGINFFRSNYFLRDITYSNCYRACRLEGAKYITISNCSFIGVGPSPNFSDYTAGVRMWLDSQYNKILSCVFSNIGYLDPADCGDVCVPIGFSNPASDQGGDVDETWYNLVAFCDFHHGGHDCFLLGSGYNVIRSNFFHNEPWMHTNGVVGCTLHTNEWVGNRITKPGDNDYAQHDERNVWEWNTLLHTGMPPDDRGGFGIELGTIQGIWRYNIICWTWCAGIYLNNEGSSNAIYNNTIFGASTTDGLQLQGEGYTEFGGGFNMSGFQPERRQSNNIVNNIIYGSRYGDVPDYATVSAWQTWRTNWVGDFGCAYPQFVSTNGMYDYYRTTNLLDLQLQSGSPCIDKGVFLSGVESANGNGTSFVVSNAVMFSDGNKIVTGDVIQLHGQVATATVTNVDLATRTLYFTPSLSWTNTQGVGLSYSGSAPDMGAYEFVAASPASTQLRFHLSGGRIVNVKQQQ